MLQVVRTRLCIYARTWVEFHVSRGTRFELEKCWELEQGKERRETRMQYVRRKPAAAPFNQGLHWPWGHSLGPPDGDQIRIDLHSTLRNDQEK